MSIFKKDCPECASPNPIDAVSCTCGYCFDPEALAGSNASEYAEQQDRLYLDYLAARIAQAEAELIVAREQAQADRENTLKAATALRAEQALNALRAEMKQLALRIPPMSHRRTPVPPIARPAVSAPPPAVPPKSAALARPKTEAVPPVKKPAAPPTPMIHSKPPVRAARDEPTRIVRSPAPEKQKTTPARHKLESAKQKAASAPKPLPMSSASSRSAVAPKPPAQVAPTRSQAVAPARFKRAQAQKAEAIARKVLAPAPARAAKPAVVAKPASPAPADIPALALNAPKSTQECPNCTATLTLDVERCGCGYAFARPSEQVPALSLDATALAILTEGISATRRR